ncbi:ABC transporter substrate-binding protein [Paenibacillus flagellatus]|uniref:Spermidine/putrescine ABC transporter substrate-binding protein n=1 Tax=Paenibacillus flagellatus TaxID=2211139 RepID=A0A2V5JYE0_9BACL|nr:extracellular solute-binding protein [Paenibacillus flagellatus]PYI51292.1 hypothetical protein DLM86_25005 [Paenibacillus flagellatus]
MKGRVPLVRALASLWMVIVLAACGSGPTSGTTDKPFAGKTINVLSWEGYQEPDWVDAFEKEHGVKVQVTYAGSVDEMFSKAASGSLNYDLIFMDGGSVTRYNKLKLIRPIDVGKLKHYGELIPNLKSINDKHVVSDGQTYAIPFAWGSLPLAVNKDKVKEPVTSWSALWDPKYKGKIATIDDANNQVATTALLLGYPDPYNLTDEQLAGVKKKLIEQKPFIRSYYSGFEDGKNLMASGEAWILFTQGPTMITDLAEQGMNVEEVIPKEGALVWIDNATIGAKTENPDLVHLYIDYLISSEVQARLILKTGYGGINGQSVSQLTQEEAKKAHMDDPSYFDRLVYVAYPESFEKRVKLWNEVRAQ